jgi:hypothetical protein
MELTNRNRVAVWVLAGVSLTGLGLYYIWNRSGRKSSFSKNKPDHHQSVVQKSNSQTFLKDKAYFELIAKLESSVDSEKHVGRFSKLTLTGINKAVFQLFKSEFLSNYQENRNLRRKYISSLADYSSELFKGSDQSEKLIDDATAEVLADLSIDASMYEREYERVSQEDPNFLLFNIYMLETIKTQIPSKNPNSITKESLKAYFKYQIDIYNDFNFTELKELSPDNATTCKQSFLSDKAAVKFAIEEEDIIKEPVLINEPEIVELQKELQNKFFAEKQNSISFPY